jgi:hypothetical protein
MIAEKRSKLPASRENLRKQAPTEPKFFAEKPVFQCITRPAWEKSAGVTSGIAGELQRNSEPSPFNRHTRLLSKS